ncbi:MAG: lysophospholipid acyltransferase family protein [Caldilineaceae bacterium]
MNRTQQNFVFPDTLPRRGNAFTRWLGQTFLRLCGWGYQVEFPHTGKFVIAGAPHTSNWDAVWAIAFIVATGLEIHFMAKAEAFPAWASWLLRSVGGIPVNRQSPENLVEQMVSEFRSRDKFVLVVAPEGTRKKVERWKSGFYRIATAANVPIVLAYLDYPKRIVGIGPTFEITGAMDDDIAAMRAYLETHITPRHPDRV